MDDPAHHVFSGHREMLGEVSDPFLDVDDALSAFDKTAKAALKRLNAGLATEARDEVSERLPWWKPERELKPAEGRAYVDILGRSAGFERRVLEAEEFVELACQALGITSESLTGPHKDRTTTRLRQLVATVGIERWGQRAGKKG